MLNGLGARSTEALGQDASVGNRMELWNSALQMAAENVHGFGSGQSGEQYMQWYQPLDRQEGYRTMVNSYLTFLVEQGWFGPGRFSWDSCCSGSGRGRGAGNPSCSRCAGPFWRSLSPGSSAPPWKTGGYGSSRPSAAWCW